MALIDCEEMEEAKHGFYSKAHVAQLLVPTEAIRGRYTPQPETWEILSNACQRFCIQKVYVSAQPSPTTASRDDEGERMSKLPRLFDEFSGRLLKKRLETTP